LTLLLKLLELIKIFLYYLLKDLPLLRPDQTLLLLIDLTLLLPKTKIEKLVPELELDPLVLLPMLKNLLNKSKKNNLLMKCKLESLLLMKMMTSIIKNKSNSKCLTLLKEKKKMLPNE
jgi:hypothetical protein